LKQLVSFVGRDAFFAGSRLYFKRFEYRNTELADFLDCLAEAAPDRNIAHWAGAWLGTSGVSELSLELTTTDASATAAAQGSGSSLRLASSTGARLRATADAGDGQGTAAVGTASGADARGGAGTGGGAEVRAPRRRTGAEKITAATITQADSAKGAAVLSPHTIEIATLGPSGRAIVPLDTFRYEFSTASAEVEQLIGRSAGVITLLNYSDLDYARVRLDPASTE